MATSPHSILVVEDELSIRSVISIFLEDAGYVVRTAPDGAAALALLESWSPDLIILDMGMPVMDGWTFLQTYQQRAAPHALVIAFTASPENEQRALAAGAAGMLKKPFELDVLLGVVAYHLGAAPPSS